MTIDDKTKILENLESAKIECEKAESKNAKCEKAESEKTESVKAEIKNANGRKQKSSKRVLRWYRLDNSARLYPSLITKNTQSLFRISFVLKEVIVPEILQQALEDTISRFPTFSVKIKRGFFWYYFEENQQPLKIFEDDGVLLAPIKTKETNHYWFKISYFNKKISLDCFHALADAGGSFAFFKTLVARYVELGGVEVGKENILDINALPTEREIEDSFLKNAKKIKLKDIELKKFAGETPLRISGKSFKAHGYGSILGMMPVAQIKAEAKKHNATINTFLSAVLMESLIRTCAKKKKKRPVVLMVPIDLRRYYGSESLRNFVLFTRVSILPEDNLSFDEIIQECDRQLKEGTSLESIQSQLDTTVKSTQTFVYKYMPLALKYATLKIGKLFLKSRQTVVFSNAGIIKMPMGVDFEKVVVHLNVSKNTPYGIGVVSYNDELMVSFTRAIVETELEKDFFTSLSNMGIDVKISSNFREEQNVL